MLSRQRLELFAPIYAGTVVQPAASLLAEEGRLTIPEREHFNRVQAEVLARLSQDGLI